MSRGKGTVMPRIHGHEQIDGFIPPYLPYNDPVTTQNEKKKTEESRAGPPLSLYIDSRIFLAAACSMSFFASSLLPRSADTVI